MSILLPLLIGIPLLGGCALLLARRMGLGDRVGELVGQSLAGATIAISILCLATTQKPAMLGEATTSVIVPYLSFAPNWLRLDFPAELATSVNGWQLSLGLDGLGLILVMLTTIVTCAVLLVANSTIERNRRLFFV